ncbi:MAG: twin-arginine translocase subunit TatC, partial [Nitrospiraceae bacterium]
LCVAFGFAFTYSADMVAWLNRPFPNQLVFYGPTEALFASIKVSFLAGVVLSLPIIFYHFWKFIEPALLPQEQRWAIPLFLLAGFLFSLGLVFCNLVILPLVIDFFVSFGMDRDITPALGVGTYIDFNVKFLLIFGCAFELPLALTLLARAGLVSAAMLARYRKHAILGSLVISAVVTPDATLFTMLLMAVPLMVLYEIGILGARWFGRGGPDPDMNLPLDPDIPIKTAGHRVR